LFKGSMSCVNITPPSCRGARLKAMERHIPRCGRTCKVRPAGALPTPAL
jgi:hypothetical protein